MKADKTASLGVTLPIKLIGRLDNCVVKSGYTSRSELIKKACDAFLDLKECDRCGALNHRLADTCAVCREPLNANQEAE